MDDRTLDDLQFPRILEAAADACQTAPGRSRVRNLPPLRTPGDVEAELALVEEARDLLDLPGHPTLDGVEDVAHAFEVAAKGGVLAAAELIACARLLTAGAETRKALADLRLRAPGIALLFDGVPDLSTVADHVASTFDADGNIRDEASPRLADLRQRVVTLSRGVKARIETMLQDPKVQVVIQDEYYTLREGRYVLPVKAEDHRFVPGIIHGTSQTGHTLFIEPAAIVEDNNQLKVVLDGIGVEERVVLADRSRLLGKHSAEARGMADALWRLDSLLGRGRLARRLHAARPTVGGPSDGLRLVDALNPVLTLLGRDVVPISLDIASGGLGYALVVSGPNAGGKSVTLSTVGLSVLMVRHGILPPAGEGSVVPWFDGVYTVIGDPTNMDRAVSTFTGQLARLTEILGRRPGRTLVLLDELATGTEPKKGEALATAVIEALVAGGAECLTATHYDLLKHRADSDARFGNARVGVDPRTGRPDYHLEQGASGESNPFDVAADCGFPAAILERAKGLVGLRERELEEALSESRRLNAALATEHAEAEDLKARLTADKKKYERELTRLRTDADRLVHEARREVLQKMKRLEEDLDAIAKQARAEKILATRPTAQPTVMARRQEVRDKKAMVHQDMDKEAALLHPSEPFPASGLKVGAIAFVATLKAEGKIVEVAGDGKRATIQVGLMRTQVKLADLRLPKAKGAKPAAPKVSPSAQSTPPKPSASMAGAPDESKPFMRSDRNTIDCRGMRVDEAVSEVDRSLDEAFLREEPLVMIIHGMGTSALRNAIREYLKTCRYCRRFRSGEMGEGGDGVTMVEVG